MTLTHKSRRTRFTNFTFSQYAEKRSQGQKAQKLNKGWTDVCSRNFQTTLVYNYVCIYIQYLKRLIKTEESKFHNNNQENKTCRFSCWCEETLCEAISRLYLVYFAYFAYFCILVTEFKNKQNRHIFNEAMRSGVQLGNDGSQANNMRK